MLIEFLETEYIVIVISFPITIISYDTKDKHCPPILFVLIVYNEFISKIVISNNVNTANI